MTYRLVLFVVLSLIVAACGNDTPTISSPVVVEGIGEEDADAASASDAVESGSGIGADDDSSSAADDKQQPVNNGEGDEQGASTPTTDPGSSTTTIATSTTTTAAASRNTTTTTAAPARSTTTTAAPTTTSAPSPTSTSAPLAAKAPNIIDLARSGRVLNIAHAGGDQAYPHSTLFAFAKAVEDGVDVLEMDVQLTADGQLVVQHDSTVDKRYNATGRVDDLTLAELQKLDGAYWFAPGQWPSHDLDDSAYIYRGVRTGDVTPPSGFSPDDFAVATLRQVAERFPSMPLDIEMKGDNPDVATALAAEILALDREESTIVVAFDDDLIASFSAAAPNVATSPGLGALTAWILGGEPLGEHVVIQVPPFYAGVPVVTLDTIELANKAGYVVWVWPDDAATQENAAFYQSMLDIGAEGMIVGKPAEFEKLVN